MIGKGIKQGSLMKEEAETLAGKINNYSNLVSGRYERCLIIHLVKNKDTKKDEVVINKHVRCQLVCSILVSRCSRGSYF